MVNISEKDVCCVSYSTRRDVSVEMSRIEHFHARADFRLHKQKKKHLDILYFPCFMYAILRSKLKKQRTKLYRKQYQQLTEQQEPPAANAQFRGKTTNTFFWQYFMWIFLLEPIRKTTKKKIFHFSSFVHFFLHLCNFSACTYVTTQAQKRKEKTNWSV